MNVHDDKPIFIKRGAIIAAFHEETPSAYDMFTMDMASLDKEVHGTRLAQPAPEGPNPLPSDAWRGPRGGGRKRGRGRHRWDRRDKRSNGEPTTISHRERLEGAHCSRCSEPLVPQRRKSNVTVTFDNVDYQEDYPNTAEGRTLHILPQLTQE